MLRGKCQLIFYAGSLAAPGVEKSRENFAVRTGLIGARVILYLGGWVRIILMNLFSCGLSCSFRERFVVGAFGASHFCEVSSPGQKHEFGCTAHRKTLDHRRDFEQSGICLRANN